MIAAALPDPIELGFPAKFQSWYPDQLRAIDKIVLGSKRFTALAMPTGAGKSVTGIAAALLAQGVTRALYLTSTKGLQDQLAADFHPLGLHDVRGQRNYSCLAVQPGGELDRYRRGRWTPGCDEGPCHAGVRCSLAPDRKDPHLRPGCIYYASVFDARRAPLVSTNYAMYLSSTAYAEGLGDFDCLILDEAHDADKELEAFLTLEITIDDVHALHTKLLKTTDVSSWRDWANHHRGPLASKVELRELHPPQDPDAAKELRAMKSILGKLQRLGDIDPLAWILDLGPLSAKFAPTRVSTYAEEFLFRHIPHVILMSATMTKKTTQLLGIPPDDLAFWECPSRFPLERRPIISVNTSPSVRVDARMSDDTKYMWLRRIDRLIEPRLELNRKGIIHTVSYQRAKDLLANSEHRAWMLVHDAANTRDTIQRFKQMDGPWILVSPSIVTGYDFPGDQCRYQIIGKIPFADMRGPIMSTRKEIDAEYPNYLAMMKLIQACGRIVRGPNDWGETFIVDDHFLWFVKKCRQLGAPRWFLDAVSYAETFPEPVQF